MTSIDHLAKRALAKVESVRSMLRQQGGDPTIIVHHIGQSLNALEHDLREIERISHAPEKQ